MTRTSQLAVFGALLTVLAGCGQAEPPAGTSTSSTVAVTSSPGVAATTTPPITTPPATTTPAAPTAPGPAQSTQATTTTAETGTEEPADQGTSGPGDTDPAPSDASVYADALVAAWAGEDTARIAMLASPEVEVATTTWSTDDRWQQRDTVSWVGEDGEDLQTITYAHPADGSRLDITISTDALGDHDAVVGADLGTYGGIAQTRAADNAYNEYADAFYQAVVDQDEATLRRYGTELAVQGVSDYDPQTHGRVIVDNGFRAFEGEPLWMLFTYPGATSDVPLAGYTHALELDISAVMAERDHGVLRLNIVTDSRWT